MQDVFCQQLEPNGYIIRRLNMRTLLYMCYGKGRVSDCFKWVRFPQIKTTFIGHPPSWAVSRFVVFVESLYRVCDSTALKWSIWQARIGIVLLGIDDNTVDP